jgi:SAM-dependent methyltransferase
MPLHDSSVEQRPDERAARLIATQREYYDLRAPDYMDPSRPSDRKARGEMTSDEGRAALASLRIEGDVLELACGSGGFTKDLVPLASSLTALDGSPTMIELNRAAVSDARVEYVCADVFSWEPVRQFDFVFFGFWLSHVPPTHFGRFFDTVRAALRPGGRCGFVDEDHRGVHHELVTSDALIPTATRTLSDGRSFDIVKVFWDPTELEHELAAHDWRASVRSIGETFLVGEAIPGE